MTPQRPLPWRAALLTLPELLLALAILAGFVTIVVLFLRDGYLHQPFIWDPADTFMDWFNPAYWANHEGTYSVWRSVYPPLTFAIQKTLSIRSCYVSSPFAGRDCDWVGITAILVSHAGAMALACLALWRNNRRTALPRSLALVLSYPALFLLERGNVLILCFAAFVIAYTDLVRRPWVRALCVGLTINFKPYLVIPSLAWAIKRQWRPLELAAILTAVVYVVSLGLIGEGTPQELADNTLNWVNFTAGDAVGELYYTTSFNSLLGVIDRGFPILRFIGSRDVELIRTVVTISIGIAQACGLAAVAGSWLQREAVTTTRLCCLLLLLSLTSKSPGGYTELFIVFLVFLEPWRGIGPIVAITTTYLISLPVDRIISAFPLVHTQAWLSGLSVNAQFGLALGQFLRPMGLLLILFALSLSTLVDVILAHRTHRPLLGLAEPLARVPLNPTPLIPTQEQRT